MSRKNSGGLWTGQGWKPLTFSALEARCRAVFGDDWRAIACRELSITHRTLNRWKAADLVTNGPVAAWLMAMEDLKDAGELQAFLHAR